MNFVPYSRMLPRALWRPVMSFFAVAQILLSFALLIEAQRGPDARAHVEEAGTTLHHAHDEANCAACIARGLLSSGDPANTSLQLAFTSGSWLSPATDAIASSARTYHALSRAPPILTA
jgi:hypothetical protein